MVRAVARRVFRGIGVGAPQSGFPRCAAAPFPGNERRAPGSWSMDSPAESPRPVPGAASLAHVCHARTRPATRRWVLSSARGAPRGPIDGAGMLERGGCHYNSPSKQFELILTWAKRMVPVPDTVHALANARLRSVNCGRDLRELSQGDPVSGGAQAGLGTARGGSRRSTTAGPVDGH